MNRELMASIPVEAGVYLRVSEVTVEDVELIDVREFLEHRNSYGRGLFLNHTTAAMLRDALNDILEK